VSIAIFTKAPAQAKIPHPQKSSKAACTREVVRELLNPVLLNLTPLKSEVKGFATAYVEVRGEGIRYSLR